MCPCISKSSERGSNGCKTSLWRREPLAADTHRGGRWVPSKGDQPAPGWLGDYLKNSHDGTAAATQPSQRDSLPRWLLLPQHSHGRGGPGRVPLRPGRIPPRKRAAGAVHAGTTQRPLTRMVPRLPPARKTKHAPSVPPSLSPGPHPEKEAAEETDE